MGEMKRPAPRREAGRDDNPVDRLNASGLDLTTRVTALEKRLMKLEEDLKLVQSRVAKLVTHPNEDIIESTSKIADAAVGK